MGQARLRLGACAATAAAWTRACNNGEGWDEACKRIGVKMKQ